MPTPVGPAEQDPNDPDYWDWGPPDDRPMALRRPVLAIVAIIVIGALLLLLFVTIL